MLDIDPERLPCRNPADAQSTKNIRCCFFLAKAKIFVTSSQCNIGCFGLLSRGRSMNSWFHLRGNRGSPSSLTAEATTIFTALV
jgi:hypothetical protein